MCEILSDRWSPPQLTWNSGWTICWLDRMMKSASLWPRLTSWRAAIHSRASPPPSTVPVRARYKVLTACPLSLFWLHTIDLFTICFYMTLSPFTGRFSSGETGCYSLLVSRTQKLWFGWHGNWFALPPISIKHVCKTNAWLFSLSHNLKHFFLNIIKVTFVHVFNGELIDSVWMVNVILQHNSNTFNICRPES